MTTAIETIIYKDFCIEIFYDEYSENPFENWDGQGRFYHWKNHGNDQYKKYCELRGMCPVERVQTRKQHDDAVLIDKYEHSGVSYSVAGEGMNCRWDTSNAWAVWFPDECLMDELKNLKDKERRKKVLEYARQACTLFNQWANGDVYGYKAICPNGVKLDSCWGFYGFDSITEHINDSVKPMIDQCIIDAEKLISQLLN